MKSHKLDPKTMNWQASTHLAKLGQALSQSDWVHCLKQLSAELHRAELADKTNVHNTVEELLPAYLAAQESGEDVAQRYPLIERHLQTCSPCRTLYKHVAAAMKLPGPWERAKTPSIGTTENVPLTADKILWQVKNISVSGPPQKRIQFRVQPSMFKDRLSPSLGTRGPSKVQETLLFSHSISLDNQPILVQAWLTSTARLGESADLRIVLVAPPSIVHHALALLDWGDKHYESKLSRGQAHFKQVPLEAFNSPVSLTLELQPHERPYGSQTPRTANRASKRTAKRPPRKQ